jgi:hypothetical protein
MNVVMNPPRMLSKDPAPERVFDNGVVGAYGAPPKDSLGEYSVYEYTVRAMIDDAQSYEESTLAPAREENLKYFYGEIPEKEGEGTSSAVSTDYRDTIMAIIPSLIRIFTSSERVVNCQPNYKGQEDAAKQCTDYLNYILWEENPGFLIVHDIIKDALRCKIGVTKWWTDMDEEVTEQVYRNITREQLQMLIYENPTVEILAAEPDDVQPELVKQVSIRFVQSKPQIKIESVPLDEFRVDRKAKSVESAVLIGQDQIVNVGQLVQAGFTMEEMEPFLGATSTYASDRSYRNSGIDEANVLDALDVRYGCYYIRIDKDGDGIPELREIHTIGDNHAILSDTIVQYARFAVWSPDPEPHTLVGDTPAELVKDIQVIKTNMLRGALDSLAQSIWPRTVFNETLVDADDVLNDEIGAAIRTKGDPSSTVVSLIHQFVGQPVFAMFDVMERLRQQRTGISDASKGLDPKALQSTASSGVDSIIAGAQERIELCARILAETGLKSLFKGLLREIVNSPNQERTLQLRGKWVNVDPSTFDPTMRISVNPTLGKGSDNVRLLALNDVKQTQILAMERFGPDNPLCGPIEFRNTLEDMLAIGNIKNVDRYYKQITEEVMAQISQTPKEPDPQTLLAQAEMEKTRAKMAENIARADYQDRKLRVDDDFRRDELTVKGLLDARKIEAQFLTDVNEQQLQQESHAIDVDSNAIKREKNYTDAATQSSAE